MNHESACSSKMKIAYCCVPGPDPPEAYLVPEKRRMKLLKNGTKVVSNQLKRKLTTMWYRDTGQS